MAFRETAVFVLLELFLVMSCCDVEGKERGISIEENLELERELRILNKPAVKSIESEYGDIYDCVDIHKQPAFDHPLLKDIKIEMRENFIRQATSKETLSVLKPMAGPCPWGTKPVGVETIKVGLKEGCPSGTVPIRRTQKEDLTLAKSVFSRNLPDMYPIKAGFGNEFAGIQTKMNTGRTYYGAGAYINIYNPAVEQDQSSAVLIRIESGTGNQLNKIHVGWRTDKKLYNGDTRTRLFTYWTADYHRSTGCFDTYCPGFVLVNSDIPLGYVFQHISSYRGTQYDVRLVVSQNVITGDWTLRINDDDHIIGFWPKRIFTGLANGADMLRWGGQVFSDTPDSPPMGSGKFENGVYDRTCWFRKTIFDYTSKVLNDLDDASVETRESRCYIEGNNSYKNYCNLGYSFLFGGTGGDKYTC